MLKACDVMTKDVVTVKPDILLKDAIRILVGKGISGLPVVDDSNGIVGMLSESDIINYMFSGHSHVTAVSEAMSKKITSVASDTDLDKIALIIGEKKFRRIPIVDNGKLVGIVSRRDIIRSLLKE